MTAHERPILIVDDDESIRTLLDMVFESYGYKTCTAFSGEDAMRILDEGLQPCMAFVDLLMPGMGGEAFLSTLKRADRLTFPTVVLSGRSDACEHVQTCHLADRCLLKPVELDELLRAAEELVH